MLVLSRKRHQKIVIKVGGKVLCRVGVCELRHDKVRLGFEAEEDVEIVREEIDQDEECAVA
jgi:carbon storage regulator CsrA